MYEDAGLAVVKPGTRTRIAQYLIMLDIGTIFTKSELKQAVGGVHGENFGRRMRELRAYGWVISTYRENASLSPDEHALLVKGSIP